MKKTQHLHFALKSVVSADWRSVRLQFARTNGGIEEMQQSEESTVRDGNTLLYDVSKPEDGDSKVLVFVTPRIIIQKEEEEKAGVTKPLLKTVR